MLKYYRSSLWFAIIMLALGGYFYSWAGLISVAILGILEVSLSFDNAVVNASVLKNWDQKWRDRFITWGLPIAVFGMRLVFPIAIVCIVADMTPYVAFKLAVDTPNEYKHILESVHHEISAFGGAFLMMVFLKFFMDGDKDHHWFGFIEKPLASIGKLDMIQAAIVMLIIVVMSNYVPTAEQTAFLTAGVCGLITFIVADSVGSLVGGEDENLSGKIIKQGVAGFLYLELLDASFSFDGVIAAFAITSNIFVIMAGLAVGAMFVRSMTLHLVDRGTLAELVYLEHSAFWAIGVLATMMFVGVAVDIPEVFIGVIGALLIGVGVYHSYKVKGSQVEDMA